jgi:hypothetical protein
LPFAFPHQSGGGIATPTLPQLFVKAMLNNLAGDARHIGGFPCEDIDVLV